MRATASLCSAHSILLLVLVMALAAPLVYPAGAFALAGQPVQPPGGKFLLGTDTLGRDVAAGIMYGARTSLIIGISATVAASLLGVLFGAIAGYYRGRLDVALMRVTELFQTIPSFILAILVVAILSPVVAQRDPCDCYRLVARYCAAGARRIRLPRRTRICAGLRGLGAGDGRIVFRHLLPNCASPLIAVGSLLVASVILFESGLSFLGLGDPNLMSWGLMISAGREVLRTAWWICTFPGLAILATVLAINLVGDGLNEALNPRLRDR